jgi:hypothetical protein
LKLLSSQFRIQVLKAILAKIRPESGAGGITAAEALRAAARVCGKTTAWWGAPP